MTTTNNTSTSDGLSSPSQCRMYADLQARNERRARLARLLQQDDTASIDEFAATDLQVGVDAAAM